ncbi:MAG TPA: hypothetical protein VHN80_30520 [Kineosporiaceae bacterium]|nr:hypothetical protein [Kineosporiaceae bacterium]
MGTHARIESDYVSIDALAWLDQRTAGTIPELTTDLQAYGARARTTDSGLYHWVDIALAWRRLREFNSPDAGDPGDAGVIAHVGTRLDAELWIARAVAPGYGRIVIVLFNDDLPVVYTDTVTDSGDWYDADTVDISCPNGHGWTWRTGRELIDAGGSFTTLTVVFGVDLNAPFSPCPQCEAHRLARRPDPCRCDRTPWIICPACGGRCDVELPPR